MVRLMVCTDEPIMAAGLRAVVDGSSEIKICGVSERILRICSEAQRMKPDVLILQVGREVNIRLLDELRHSLPGCRIVLLVRDFSLGLAAQAVNLGIAGILRSSMSLELVEKCLLRVAAGEKWFEKDLILQMLSAKTVSLTPRERQLVRLLAQGLCNKEIGKILDLRESTVKVYLSKLYRKAGVSDRLELALIGIRNLGLAEMQGDAESMGLRSIIVNSTAREEKWSHEKAD